MVGCIMPVASSKSAAEAAEIARNYVVALAKSPDVSIDGVTLSEAQELWEVQGSYRCMPFARSRRFQLQLRQGNGGITWFTSPPRPSLAPLVTGIGVIIGILIFMFWLFFLSSN